MNAPVNSFCVRIAMSRACLFLAYLADISRRSRSGFLHFITQSQIFRSVHNG